MVEYIDFEIFEKYPEVLAAFSTKRGGVSVGIYESMNLSLGSNDRPENIKENYRRFAEALHTTPDRFVISDQQHTTNIRIVSKEDAGKGTIKPRDYEAIDGFVTNERNLVLCLLFADCVPVYIYDPEKHAIALVHSGWRGTAGCISEKAVRLMQKEYDSRPEDIIALIGPSICKSCYEVSEDLVDEFKKNFADNEVNLFFEKSRVVEAGETKKEQKYLLDLWKAIELTLEKAGVRKENIHNSQICTFENHELLFSHRYTKGKRGNLAAVMALKDNK